MKTKADKHREAGTLEQFRARQKASREGTARYQARLQAERNAALLEPTLEERVAELERRLDEL